MFAPAEVKLAKDVEALWGATRPVLRQFKENPNNLEPIRAYFKEVYWQRGREALDGAKVGSWVGILPAIKERAKELTFPFASIAEAFQLIEDYKEPVIVPWRADPEDRRAEKLLAAIESKPRPSGSDYRRLQQYTVSIRPEIRRDWLAWECSSRCIRRSGTRCSSLRICGDTIRGRGWTWTTRNCCRRGKRYFEWLPPAELVDVAYSIEAHFDLTEKATKEDTPAKHISMFNRRAASGQCFHQPCLGTREFPADFRLLAETEPLPDSELRDDQRNRDLGWMLYDIDFADGRTSRFFRARLTDGVLDVTRCLAEGEAA
ncbi:MAG TPA: type I-E CRISPR-associated protein Cas5/CasD [Roseiarcus sp.]|nr:type I-E CRISPR-associated protein Cas5/CasD [Roseiarcus sp.]